MMSRFGRVYTPISQPVLALPELDLSVLARVVEKIGSQSISAVIPTAAAS